MARRTRSSKRVFVAYGHDTRITAGVFRLLRSLGLEPLDWPTLERGTGRGSPHNLEIVQRGIEDACCAIVIWHAEEKAQTLTRYSESAYRLPAPELQPRLNVVLEAGMALGVLPGRVVFVAFGETREVSNLGGIHMIRWDVAKEPHVQLAAKLKALGADVAPVNDDWKRIEFGTARSTLPRARWPRELSAEVPPGAVCYGVWYARDHAWHTQEGVSGAIRDTRASRGAAWKCEGPHPLGHCVFGPYVALGRGNYEAYFRVRLERSRQPGENATVRQRRIEVDGALLDVYDQRRSIETLELPTVSRGKESKFSLHRIPFSLPEATEVELRVTSGHRQVTTYTDFTAITREPPVRAVKR